VTRSLEIDDVKTKAYPEALRLLRQSVAGAPHIRAAHLWFAATYAQLGQTAEANAEAAEVLRIEPK